MIESGKFEAIWARLNADCGWLMLHVKTGYNNHMAPRIAIPVPHSGDPEYAQRALPQYEDAVRMAGGEPVRIPLDGAVEDVVKLVESCDAVLLPGSKADIDPTKYEAARDPHTAEADGRRDAVDDLLLQDAYNMRKPVLGICYGLQALNVYRTGTLVQHIVSPVNHEAGRTVPVAHTAEVDPDSKLAEILRGDGSRPQDAARLVIPVNSSHHQSADVIGDGLRMSARCLEDGVIEAVEGTSPDHFVLAVQWHPERSVENDESSRAIFRALIEAAQARQEKIAGAIQSV